MSDIPIHGAAHAREVLAALGLDQEPQAAFAGLGIFEQLRAIERAVGRLREAELRSVMIRVAAALGRAFLPFPGPQTAAFLSKADVLLFGGAAGGGKTRLLIGACEDHRRSLILRREATELDGLVAELQEVYGRDGYNRVEREHSAPGAQGSRSIKLGGMREAEDWRHFAGRPRDLMEFDEAGEFLEMQVRALLAWNRSPDPAQRCRAILGSNPPRTAAGEWLGRWFAPWIDPGFPNPAQPGELRWAIWVGDDLRWVDGPAPVEIDGETYTPRSYTFIPAKLADNPFQDQAHYRAQLQNLPEPLRSQLLHGNFLAGREDDAWQVIPSDWIQAARLRWTARPPEERERPPGDAPMTAIGVDVAQGGPDQTVLAPRHGRWFAPLQVHKGIDTKDGPAVAGLVVAVMRDGCTIVVDLGGGWGGSTLDHLRDNFDEDAVVGFVPAGKSEAKTADGLLGFINIRAWAWWKFREALDPNSGADIALPPDPELSAELAMPRYKLTPRGLQIELKEEIRKRLGRSTDKGDAVVMSWAYGDERAASRGRYQRPIRVNLGHAAAKGLRVISGGRPEGAGRYQSAIRVNTMRRVR